MPDVVMPRLSDSMEEGTILKWLKAPGDMVARGEELAEIETDKATMTYESDSDGVLEIVAQEGETLPIGAVIARIGGGGSNGAPTTPAAAAEVPAAAPAPVPAPDPPKPPPVTPSAGARVKASPLARRIAKERGIDISSLQGSGPGGRIVKADVEGTASTTQAQPAATPAPASAPPPAPAPAPVAIETGTAKGDVTATDLSRTQQVIARRMAESRATVPAFTLQAEIDMERCVELRAELKAVAAEGDPVPSYNDMVVKASAIALREYPRANGAYKDGRFELYSRVNVGVAVAAQDALVVPTVFDADRKSLREISADTRALAERVRAGAITPPELSGGTFTVSNLGMFGVRNFAAGINPPQEAILAVGELSQRPAVRDGEVIPRPLMDVTLACDHRILYGADAATFLARIRELLERPVALLL